MGRRDRSAVPGRRPWASASRRASGNSLNDRCASGASRYPEQAVTHDDYFDALFNRNGRSCRGLYDSIRARERKGPSVTRRNTDALVKRLRDHGVGDVLETNVVCYSTAMSADLAAPEHAGGAARGTLLFETLLDAIEPEILVAHGVGTAKALGRLLHVRLPAPPATPSSKPPELTWRRRDNAPGSGTTAIFVLPALSPPAWTRWASWAPEYLDRLAAAVADRLRDGSRR